MVKEELTKLGLHFIVVDLGEVDIIEDITEEQQNQLKIDLHTIGLELMDDKKSILFEEIKKSIVEMVFYQEEFMKLNFSTLLSEKLNCDYAYLANLFTEVQGTTIEQFIIHKKVERIKELIAYGELSISEIAWKMNYCNVAHLSYQFKKITGLPPSHFKQLKKRRVSL